MGSVEALKAALSALVYEVTSLTLRETLPGITGEVRRPIIRQQTIDKARAVIRANG